MGPPRDLSRNHGGQVYLCARGSVVAVLALCLVSAAGATEAAAGGSGGSPLHLQHLHKGGAARRQPRGFSTAAGILTGGGGGGNVASTGQGIRAVPSTAGVAPHHARRLLQGTAKPAANGSTNTSDAAAVFGLRGALMTPIQVGHIFELIPCSRWGSSLG